MAERLGADVTHQVGGGVGVAVGGMGVGVAVGGTGVGVDVGGTGVSVAVGGTGVGGGVGSSLLQAESTSARIKSVRTGMV